jgi:hypothetical protein
VSEDALLDQDPAWVASLGPDDARWVLVLGLEDIFDRTTFGRVFGAECRGWLFDKRSGRAVWRHQNTHQEGFGGLAGLMMGAFTPRDLSVHECFRRLVQEIPSRE